jgi:iron complex transport system ATP-binding protein
MYRLLGQINRDTGTAIVSITHDINSAIRGSHRVLAMKAGRVAFLGTPAELARAEVLQGIYDIPFALIPVPDAPCPLVFPALDDEGGPA